MDGREGPTRRATRPLTWPGRMPTFPGFPRPTPAIEVAAMKVVCSLKTAKKRDKNCRIVRRKGRVYVINKRNPRFKARQG